MSHTPIDYDHYRARAQYERRKAIAAMGRSIRAAFARFLTRMTSGRWTLSTSAEVR